MNKIILFYKYIAITYPKQIMKWQQQIGKELDLTGRVLISHEGINGTLGGSQENINHYMRLMSAHELFGTIDFKESEGGPECFPRLMIKVKDEAVSLGINPDDLTTKSTGIHLTPDETHNLISQNPQDLLIFDARNDYEWHIGKFNNAVTPAIQNFRELPKYIDENLDKFKDKQVLMYCTGGIRCERASAYLNVKNVAKKIYQMDGGIVRYAEKYPDGFFRGKYYVFDARIALKINDDILGSCAICKKSCDDYYNCLNAKCNKHFIGCHECIEQLNKTCGQECQKLLAENKAPLRPEFNKVNSFKK